MKRRKSFTFENPELSDNHIVCNDLEIALKTRIFDDSIAEQNKIIKSAQEEIINTRSTSECLLRYVFSWTTLSSIPMVTFGAICFQGKYLLSGEHAREFNGHPFAPPIMIFQAACYFLFTGIATLFGAALVGVVQEFEFKDLDKRYVDNFLREVEESQKERDIRFHRVAS